MSEEPFDNNFNIGEYRRSLAARILRNSRCMTNNCSYYCPHKITEDLISCSGCRRCVHMDCIDIHHEFDQKINWRDPEVKGKMRFYCKLCEIREFLT